KPTLSVQLYAQPFVAAGSYSRFKEVVDPRAKEFYDRFRNLDDELNCVNGNCDVDLDNDGSADFSFVQPDFNFGEIRSTLVIRWEYKPGSVLFFAWQHGRSNSRSDGSFNWRDDLSDVLSTAADNTLLVKVNYWISI
ncbi:MAG: hydrolase, partial [candidate division Zixibacteria bacterium]|nr:hydrolase [candidate division Zixibacteria bacterium]